MKHILSLSLLVMIFVSLRAEIKIKDTIGWAAWASFKDIVCMKGDEIFCCSLDEKHDNCGGGSGVTCTNDLSPKLEYGSHYLLCPNPTSWGDREVIADKSEKKIAVDEISVGLYCSQEIKNSGEGTDGIRISKLFTFESIVYAFKRTSENRIEKIGVAENGDYEVSEEESLILLGLPTGLTWLYNLNLQAIEIPTPGPDPKPEPESEGSSKLILIIGISVGIFAVALALLITIICCIKRRKSKTEKSEGYGRLVQEKVKTRLYNLIIHNTIGLGHYFLVSLLFL